MGVVGGYGLSFTLRRAWHAPLLRVKAAIVGLSRSLAREVGGDGIIVNTLCPDLIPDEDITARQGTAADERTVAGRCLKRTQLPEDMVGTAAFLFSDLAGFVTGQSLLVNGGAHFN